ncbi:hypothetical protein LJL02_003237 [Escherichia coli]|nr:hypothetical protein [Escherichia coli]ELR3255742.1 hypothetical protein [Escherichia coli]ELR3349245.1 hypothetical protein [Escherichia coli]ELR3353821.1 hypothetical protein [Escherichia coli]ELR3358854.1 hypothetical protein [Escherichia coli]
MAYIFIFLVAVFSFDSAYAVSTTEHLGSTSGTYFAVASPGGVDCTYSYETCSGDTFYCSTSYSSETQIPGMSAYLVTGNWTTYKVYHYEDGVKVYSQCKDSYYGSFLGASYSAKPTEEVCLSRPEINASLSDVYMDDKGNKYVTIHGCIYEATGDVISCSDDSTHCSATWKPVTVDPSYSDKEDTEDKGDNGNTGGGSSGGSSGGGSSGGSSGGGSSGGSSGGGSSGGSSGGGSSGGSSGGGSSGGSSGGGSSGGSSGGGSSGGSSGGSTSGDGDGWLGDILGWLQRIWSSVNDLNSFFSLSQADLNNSLNTFDGQLTDVFKGEDGYSSDDYDSLTSGFIDKLPKEWLFIDFDKLFFSDKLKSEGAQPLEVSFLFSLPVIGNIHFSIDTTVFSSLYDSKIRPIVEYAIYLFTMLRVYSVFRRSLFRHSEL